MLNQIEPQICVPNRISTWFVPFLGTVPSALFPLNFGCFWSQLYLHRRLTAWFRVGGEWHDPGRIIFIRINSINLKIFCICNRALWCRHGTNQSHGRTMAGLSTNSNRFEYSVLSSATTTPEPKAKRIPPNQRLIDRSIECSVAISSIPSPMGNGDDGSARIGIIAFRLRQLHTAQPNPFFMNF